MTLAIFADAVGQDERAATIVRGELSKTQDGFLKTHYEIFLVIHELSEGNILEAVQRIVGANEPRKTLTLCAQPLLNAIALARVDDPLRGEELARAAAEIFREVVRGKAEAVVWHVAASILESAFGLTSIDELDALEKGDDHGLWLAVQFGSSLRSERALKNVLERHVAVAKFQIDMIAACRQSYRRMFLPYLEWYWTGAAENPSSGFRNPTALKAALARTPALSVRGRAQQILRLVARGLNATADPRVEEWWSPSESQADGWRRLSKKGVSPLGSALG